MGQKIQTGIEKIKQHIGECHLRLEQKRAMWVQAQNDGLWLESESLGKTMNVERAFMQGLERALAYIEGDEIIDCALCGTPVRRSEADYHLLHVHKHEP